MIWLLALLLLGAHGSAAHYGESHGFALPDAIITPGTMTGATTADLCAPGYAASVRHVTETRKVRVCLLYGVDECPGPKWEIDHLVSLELGGSNELANLWPQPIAEARKKDWLENRLHREVCAGLISLEEAQRSISTDWATVYREKKRGDRSDK